MRHAFTLIELLIVVAIIAILAAIAVPNFLEAQVRAKVSRVKNDMRTMATGLESYMVDHNAYPNCHMYGIASRNYLGGAATDPLILERLSTPVAFLTNTTLKDPFKVSGRFNGATAQILETVAVTPITPATDTAAALNSLIYQSFNSQQRYTLPPDGYSVATKSTSSNAYVLHSCGPDGNYYNLGGVLSTDQSPGADRYTISLVYDSTNGTVSRGSIYREGGSATKTSSMFAADLYAAGESLRKAIQSSK